MYRYTFLLVAMATFITMQVALAQVGIGTTKPAGSAVLDLKSTQQGFLPPRMNSAQRDAIPNPENGLVIYNTEERALNVFTGDYWESSRTGISVNPCVSPQPFVVGGAGTMLLSSIDADSEGNYLLAGSFMGTATFGTEEVTAVGGFDMFLAKYSPTGELIWHAAGGTAGFETIRRVKIGDGGDIFLSGSVSGNFSFLNTTFTLQQGNRDLFVARLSPQGVVAWVQYARLNGEGEMQDMDINAVGDIYVAGRFSGDMNPGGTFALSSSDGTRFFIARLSAMGQWIFAQKAVGTSTGSNISRLKVRDNFIYVSGTFENGNLEVGNTIVPNTGANNFLARLQPNGSFVWGLRAGGINQSFEGPLSIHPSGDVIWSVMFQGTGFTLGSLPFNSVGNLDVVVARFSTTGTALWSRLYGGAASDFLESMTAVSDSGRLYAMGRTSGASNFGGTALPGLGSFICAMDPANGNLEWLTNIPSINNLFTAGIVYKPGLPIIFAARSGGTVSFGPAACNQRTATSSTSAFFGKIMPDGTIL